MQVHEKRKHLKQDVQSMQQLAQDYQNLKQHYDKIMHENKILVTDNQNLLNKLNMIQSQYPTQVCI